MKTIQKFQTFMSNFENIRLIKKRIMHSFEDLKNFFSHFPFLYNLRLNIYNLMIFILIKIIKSILIYK